MKNGHLTAVLHHISKLVAPVEARQQSDRELLSRFVTVQDQTAFAALVERHGPMVLGVCRRVLPRVHDAEDACQAAFLVLARKASSIRKWDSVASWLHGVAYRSALNLRRDLTRSRSHEQPLTDVPGADEADDLSWREMMDVLDAELERLPARLRAPLVLCYLQGKTRDEAAQDLGWTTATLRGRLERGRRLLRSRLTRRGLALSAALIAPALARQAQAAALPATRVVSTIKAATLVAAGQTTLPGLISAKVTAVTEGVLKAMVITQLKMAALVVLAVGILGAGAGTLTYHPQAAEVQPAREDARPIELVAEKAEVDPGETWRLIRTLSPAGKQQPSLYSVAFSPDGKRLAVGGLEGQVTLWDVASGQAVVKLDGPAESARSRLAVNAVQFSPDGKVLASAGEDRTVKLWDVATGRERSIIPSHSESVLSVAFSPDGKVLASGGGDQQVRLWDVKSGKVLTSSQAPRLGGGITFSPDGKTLAAGSTDATVRLWDVATGKEIRHIGQRKFHSIYVINASAAFSPDGKVLAGSSNDMAVHLWDVASGKELAALNGHENVVMSLAFSPDGRILATAGMDKKIICWDLSTFTISAKLLGHQGFVRSLAFSPDGRLLASAGDDGTVKIWERRMGPASSSVPQGTIKPPATEADRLERLVKSLINAKKTDRESVDALFLATLGRFPTETEMKFAAGHVETASDRQKALDDLLFVLTNSKEFTAHVQSLQQRLPRPTP